MITAVNSLATPTAFEAPCHLSTHPRRRAGPAVRRHRRGGVLMRLLGALLVLSALTAAGVAGGLWWWAHQPLRLAAPAVEWSIEQGTTPRGVAQGWVDAGVRTSPWLLYQWFRWSGQARQIRAGSYEVGQGTTPARLLDMMVQGDETLSRVKLIEGWTFRRWRQEMAAADGLRLETQGWSDAQLMRALGSDAASPEGQFFPDTYAYAKGSTDLAVMKRAHKAMRRHLADAWAQRSAASPLKTPRDVLILASIVEKETGHGEDRPMISGVFSNRLRLGMPLQTDPTVIYGLGEAFDGNLRKVHLQTDTPFNTYTRGGLPPTPIAMPGKASLLAAVRPAPTRALYFVAQGNGRSAFSETLAEHNRAVNRFQRNKP